MGKTSEVIDFVSNVSVFIGVARHVYESLIKHSLA